MEQNVSNLILELAKKAKERNNDIEIRHAKDGKIKVYEVSKTLVGVYDTLTLEHCQQAL